MRSPTGHVTYLLVFVLSCLVGPAFAAQDRVTLRLENVTLLEALDVLGHRTKVDATVGGNAVRDLKPDPKATRASFAWDQAAPSTAYRDVAKAFGLVAVGDNPYSVDLVASRPPDRTPYHVQSKGGAFLITGMKKTATGLTEAGQPNAAFGAAIQFTARPDHGDPDLLYALSKTKVVTDKGPAQALPPGELLMAEQGFDDMRLFIPVAKIPAGAHKITLLEGKVVSYRDVRYEKSELTLPAKGPTTLGPVKVEVKRTETSPDHGYRLELEATWPGDVKLECTAYKYTAWERWPIPQLRRKSGQPVRLNIDGQDLTERPPMPKPDPAKKDDVDEDEKAELAPKPANRVRIWLSANDLDPADPVEALVWNVAFHHGPDLRIPFRFENIPLPVVPPEEPPAAAADKTGLGEIVSPVALPEDAPADRELALGLARKLPNGEWGPLRWRTLYLNAQGLAHLEGLPPGTYRVLRALLGAGTGRTPGTSALHRISEHWQNESVVVEVRAGEAVRLPALRPPP